MSGKLSVFADSLGLGDTWHWRRNEINIAGVRWARNPKGWVRMRFLGRGGKPLPLPATASKGPGALCKLSQWGLGRSKRFDAFWVFQMSYTAVLAKFCGVPRRPNPSSSRCPSPFLLSLLSDPDSPFGRGNPPLSSAPLPFPFSSPLLSPSLPFKVGSLTEGNGSGKRCKFHQVEPSGNRICAF